MSGEHWSTEREDVVRPPVGQRAGFTLLEAVIALAILGMVSVATVSAVSSELRLAERTTHAVQAAALARDRLARLELLTIDELQRVPDSLTTGRFPRPFSEYAWSATTAPTHGERDLYDLSVSVRWASGEYHLAGRVYRPLKSRAGA